MKGRSDLGVSINFEANAIADERRIQSRKEVEFWISHLTQYFEVVDMDRFACSHLGHGLESGPRAVARLSV